MKPCEHTPKKHKQRCRSKKHLIAMFYDCHVITITRKNNDALWQFNIAIFHTTLTGKNNDKPFGGFLK